MSYAKKVDDVSKASDVSKIAAPLFTYKKRAGEKRRA